MLKILDNIISLSKVTKYYGHHCALKEISFQVKKGSLYGLLGPNGSGKSTLIHLLSGLLPFDSGACRLFDMPIQTNRQCIQKQMGIVPQEYALYEDLKAIENVMLFTRLYGLDYKQAKAKVENALKKVNLWDVRNGFPYTFSGGMKKRLNIACAIVHEPKLLIMDEPTASLDPVSRDDLLQQIKDLNRQGCSILYTSHYLEEVELLCDHATILNKGMVLAEGSIPKIKQLLPYTHQISLLIDGSIRNSLEIFTRQLPIAFEPTLSNHHRIVANCNEPAKNLPLLMMQLQKQGMGILDLQISPLSLDQVFLKLIHSHE